MPEWAIIFFVLVAIAVVGLAVFGFMAERKRRGMLAAEAARLGLTFLPQRDRTILARFDFLSALGKGSNRYAHNILRGNHQGESLLCFDYHYQVTTSNGKSSNTRHYYFAVYSLQLPRAFPGLVISPENLFTRAAAALGFGAISFESAEFTRTFRVNSKDRKFAYDFCHPRIMEFLLKRPRLNLELEGDLMCVVTEGRMKPESLAAEIEFLIQTKALLPAYLFETPFRS